MIEVAGKTVTTEQVTFNERVFGKSAKASATLSLETSYDAFAKRFAPIYEAALDELRADDAVTGRFSPPFAGATHYPSLDELFALPDDQRMEMIDAFFAVDILRLLLPEAAPGARWTVRSLTGVARKGDVLRLTASVDES